MKKFIKQQLKRLFFLSLLGVALPIYGAEDNGEIRYSVNQVKKVLRYLRSSDIDIWLTSVYKQKECNQTITLHIKKSDKPVILLLESHQKVNWLIKNPYKTKIEAVVLHSKKGISVVEGDIEQKKVFPIGSELGEGYSLEEEYSCSCEKIRFSCTGSGIRWSKIAQYIVWNKKITGLSGAYNSKSLYIPEKSIGDEEYALFTKVLKNDEKIRQACIEEEVKMLMRQK